MLPLPVLIDVVIRMFWALAIGCIIGVDRDLHGKPTGMKTLGLVSLGACLTTMAAMGFATQSATMSTDVSRAIQGIVTGIGFLGAGVIVQTPGRYRIRGLTTAASIWVTAAVGIVCGLGVWSVAVIATVLLIALLVIGRRVEKALHRQWIKKPPEEREASTDLEDLG
ncbi:MgtC/SapB family protein [Caballeronia sp. dw_276]|jgi:putative Mg2+ transporter-C (MgtC) family protein|uniref:MgtC/SapB family protein n=1 Tax=Caballeronia sp. dw_276 TaxID=2719795 RepID=UPI001BD3EC82|nr:MgtC/SapB family protein [Caballeronia sp. dw_276]